MNIFSLVDLFFSHGQVDSLSGANILNLKDLSSGVANENPNKSALASQLPPRSKVTASNRVGPDLKKTN